MLPIINNFPINSIKIIKIVYKTKKNIYEEIVLIFSLHLNNLHLKNLKFYSEKYERQNSHLTNQNQQSSAPYKNSYIPLSINILYKIKIKYKWFFQ